MNWWIMKKCLDDELSRDKMVTDLIRESHSPITVYCINSFDISLIRYLPELIQALELAKEAPEYTNIKQDKLMQKGSPKQIKT